MTTTEDQLKHFTAFVNQRIGSGGASDLGLSELFDLWMLENPTDAGFADNIAAINASINDFMKGERGTPAGEHSRELREQYGLSEADELH